MALGKEGRIDKCGKVGGIAAGQEGLYDCAALRPSSTQHGRQEAPRRLRFELIDDKQQRVSRDAGARRNVRERVALRIESEALSMEGLENAQGPPTSCCAKRLSRWSRPMLHESTACTQKSATRGML